MFPKVPLLQHLRAALEWAEARHAEVLGSPALVPVLAAPLARKVVRSAAVALSLGALASPAAAHWDRDDLWMDGRLVDVQVQVEGQAAPLYVAPGRIDRKYLQAFEGKRYSLVLRNNTARRIGVLIAVDGLNVVNGERSRLASGEPMYVLDPYERTVIRGWRTSLEQVRRFVFVDEERSYAERTGQANSDMGWVRVLAFRERTPVVWRQDAPRVKERERRPFEAEDRDAESDEWMGRNEDAPRSEAAPPSASKSLDRRAAPEALEQKAEGGSSFPGTGWGERTHDPVNRTHFIAERSATDRLTIRYEYASGLRALGIRIHRDRLYEREGSLGFAKPPRW